MRARDPLAHWCAWRFFLTCWAQSVTVPDMAKAILIMFLCAAYVVTGAFVFQFEWNHFMPAVIAGGHLGLTQVLGLQAMIGFALSPFSLSLRDFSKFDEPQIAMFFSGLIIDAVAFLWALCVLWLQS